jgi:4-hydroxy-tetrahydrodipicolinate reductase
MGHVGLPESMTMIFDTLGRDLRQYEAAVEPVLADRLTNTDYFAVQPGYVKGLKQTAVGYDEAGEFGLLTFVAALDMPDDGDTIEVTGKPSLTVNLKGTNGDLATVAIAVNAVRRVVGMRPGLVTMRDLPIVTAAL